MSGSPATNRFGRFFQGQLVGFVQGLVGWDCDVGDDTYAFPIGFRDGVDRSRKGHGHFEVFVDSVASDRVSSATARLANNGGPLEVFEVVREFFGG